MLDNLRLKIGNTILLCKGDSSINLFKNCFSKRFSGFLCKEQISPDILININKTKETPSLLKGKKVFETYHPKDKNINWKLYKNNDKYILKQYSIFFPGRLRLLSMLNKGFTKSNTNVIDTNFPNNTHFYYKNESQIIYSFFHLLLINYLIKNRGLIIHGAGINYDNKTILFVGPTGAGKTTISRLWSNFSKVKVLSNDRIIVRKKDIHYMLYPIPWYSEPDDYLDYDNDGLKLNKIFFIYPNRKNICYPVDETEAFKLIFPNIFPPFWDKNHIRILISFCFNLIENIPCFKLGFINNVSIINFIKDIA